MVKFVNHTDLNSEIMGKGDIKTKKGKIARGSYGARRKKVKKATAAHPDLGIKKTVVAKKESSPTEKKPAAVKKPAVKKPASKKKEA
jgi:ribosomal small subunit protein bTHX